jgi:Putative transposase
MPRADNRAVLADHDAVGPRVRPSGGPRTGSGLDLDWPTDSPPPFAEPRRCSPTPATLPASPSRPAGWSRLDESGVIFRYKDYRHDGQARYRTMPLAPDEFIKRFPLHVLPQGFHRIRHYGLLASAGCKANIARAGELIAVPGRRPIHRSRATTPIRPPAPQQTIARHALAAAGG